MSNIDHYECGEMGPFWVIIQDSWRDTLEIRVLKGDWDVIDPIQLPLDTNLDFARAKARLECKKLLRKWLDAVEHIDARVPLT